jgi:hypothetical protein
MAKSDFNLTKGIQVSEKDAKVTNSLKIEMEDATGTFMFFVSIDNAEFVNEANDVEAYDADGITVEYSNEEDGKEMVVEVTVTGTEDEATFNLPLYVTLKGGDATVEVDGNGTAIEDNSPVIFARTSDTKATVTVADAASIYSDIKTVAEITIAEPFKDILIKDADADGDAPEIKFTIRHSDFEFTAAAEQVVEGERGFSTLVGDLGTFELDDDDDGVLIFTPDADVLKDAVALGRLVFTLELDSTEKAPSTGDLNIKVDGDNVSGATVKVAEVKAFGTEIEMDDEKVVDVVAGQSKEITFTVKEAVNDTFTDEREFDIVFENAFLAPRKDDVKYGTEVFSAKDYLKDFTLPDDLTFVDAIINDDDYVIGMTVTIDKDALDEEDEDEFEFEDLEVFAALGATGDVKITVSGRALDEEASVVAMNVKEAVKVTADPMTIKVGLKEQTGGKLVIAEADAAVMKQGEEVYVKIDNSDSSGLKLKDTDLEDKIVVTSGDLVLDEDSFDVVDGAIVFTVKRESTEASTITIKDLTVYADRTVPQGTYDVKIGGSALAEEWTTAETSTIKDLKVEEFVIIGTPNTEDLATNGLKKGTSSFVIGSSKYVVNGVEAEMDGAPYIDNGRTMVPVRYVANALGVPGTDIYFAAGTATVIAGSKTVSLTVGDKVAKLNGVAARTMVSAPVVKDGRTYVPVAEIGALLGVEATWDSATQTATFTNK